jgi:hypothetical protein
VRVQALPPNPVLQAHVAVHLISVIAHDFSTLPDGSEYTQAPLPEHTEPWNGMKGVGADVRLSDDATRYKCERFAKINCCG